MSLLSHTYIRDHLADSPLIFDRGKQTFENGSYFLSQKDTEQGRFVYEFDGAYGHYTTRLNVSEKKIEAHCNCSYTGNGCRHAVAAALNARDILLKPRVQKELFPGAGDPYLTDLEIKNQALADRIHRAKTDTFTPVRGDMFTGDHKLTTKEGRTYTICLHDPLSAKGHCSCPDYSTNGLGTCKHILFMAEHLKAEPGFKTQTENETLPFVDIFWDSLTETPRLFPGPLNTRTADDLKPVLGKYFDTEGNFIGQDISLIMGLMLRLHGDKRVKIRDSLLKRVDHRLQALQLEKMAGRPLPKINLLRPLYPFQEKGVDFGVLKTGVLIGDEMGLGKTAQAIALSLVKGEVFGFSSILVITLASLKNKWKQEVEAMTRETACIVQGTPSQRKALYNSKSRFKISHYEAALRDVQTISGLAPDIIILDEAQRIRNFSTRTAEAVKRLPKKHAIVLTGTPLENKPEDLYSIVQFIDPFKFTPLWKFAADHFLVPKTAKTNISGYKNLDMLQKKMTDILIRRTWEDVIEQLPDTVTNTYYIDLAPEQHQRHTTYAERLSELLGKKILTPMDFRQIQTLVLRMRMVANSTFLVDRETQVSPKLRELSTIIDEVVVQNQRKMIIFSEWTAMTFLVARHLSEAGIGFVEVSGKTPDAKRHTMAEQFLRDENCPVFLTTDAGAGGLDLSSARRMVNVELPWTPEQMNRRKTVLTGKNTESTSTEKDEPRTSHIINLIGTGSIEERIFSGFETYPDLFTEFFETGVNNEQMDNQDRQIMADQLRRLLGTDLLPLGTGPRLQDIPEEDPYLLFPEGMTQPDQGGAEEGSPSLPLSDSQKLEKVLNSGLDFMTGLAEIATGKKIKEIENREISIDPKTGQVNLSFKLPKNLN